MSQYCKCKADRNCRNDFSKTLDVESDSVISKQDMKILDVNREKKRL